MAVARQRLGSGDEDDGSEEKAVVGTAVACASFKSLAGSPKELWCAFVLKVLESYAYFSLSLNMVIHLSDELGFDDTTAGFIYGLFGFAISFFGLVVGVVIDYLGVKWALTVGALISAAGRFLFAVATTKWLAVLSALLIMPIGMAMGIPVLVISIKRSTTPQNRAFGFSLFYACMNIAALVSGPATDLFRYLFGDGITLFGGHVSALRLLFLTGVVTSLIQAMISALGMREVNMNAQGEVENFKPKRGNTRAFICKMLRDRRFWRLTVFVLLVIAVRTLFRHLDATFPKYLKRELGENAAYGTIYAINPTIILVLVPIIGAYTVRVHPFAMVLRGSLVSAVSAFFLCIGAYYWTAILFVVTLSLGEAVYSPSVYTYTMMLAPKGREGLYAGLANAPMFVAKLFVGGLSGVLLTEFCPASGPRHCGTMWLIIGVIATSSPVCMFLLRNFIEPDRNKPAPEHESDDEEDAGGDSAVNAGGIQLQGLGRHRRNSEGATTGLMSADAMAGTSEADAEDV